MTKQKSLMAKLMGLMLAVVMALAMVITAVPAMAATDATKGHTITINKKETDTENHTYAAYQIFTGDLSEIKDNDGKVTGYKLSNVSWGDGVDTAKITGDVATKIEKATNVAADDVTDAGKVAEALSSKTNDSTDAQNFADAISLALTEQTSGTSSDNTIKGVPNGYYLVEETTDLKDKQSAKTRFILEVVGADVSVKAKYDIPSTEKKVRENDTNTVAEGEDPRIPGYSITNKYNDVADYTIGDTVPYELIGTLPSDYDKYETYKYIFSDTMTTGLTLDTTSVKVYKNSVAETNDITTNFNINATTYSPKDGTTLTVSAITAGGKKGLKEISGLTAGDKIIVAYNATLNGNAIIGPNGNPNTMTLEFSNNPNQGGEGETGKTPVDKNIVFTYEVDVTKYAGEKNEQGTNTLGGAKFVILNANSTKALKVEDDGTVNKKFSWVNVPTTTDVKENSDAMVNAYENAGAAVFTSDSTGKIAVAGLDEGTYVAKEIKAPDGYSLASDTTIKIEATTVNNQDWDGTSSKALTGFKYTVNNGTAVDQGGTGNPAIDGIAKADVIDKAGSSLPTTGGIGTTIFYVVGIICVLGAGIALVVRRKMER